MIDKEECIMPYNTNISILPHGKIYEYGTLYAEHIYIY